MPTTPDYGSSNGATRRVGAGDGQRLIVVSYILAVAMPPLGLLLGIGIAARRNASNSRHALLIILISILAAGVWAAIIASGALTATNGSY